MAIKSYTSRYKASITIYILISLSSIINIIASRTAFAIKLSSAAIAISLLELLRIIATNKKER
jgi:hypothetical protein